LDGEDADDAPDAGHLLWEALLGLGGYGCCRKGKKHVQEEAHGGIQTFI